MEPNKQSNIDRLIDILDRIITLTHGCDTKTSIVLGCLGVFAGGVLSSDNIKSFCRLVNFMVKYSGFLRWMAYIGFSLAALLLIGGFICLVCALISRTEPPKLKEKGLTAVKGLVFFGDIAKNENAEAYYSEVKKTIEISEDEKGNDLRKEYINEIYFCSKICQVKYKYYRCGLFLSAIGVALFFAVALIGIIVNRSAIQ